MTNYRNNGKTKEVLVHTRTQKLGKKERRILINERLKVFLSQSPKHKSLVVQRREEQ